MDSPGRGRGLVCAFASTGLSSGGAGAVRTLALDDGTLTSLDVDSEVTVKMTAQARAVDLVKGRVFFDVAHDAQRPFSVAVGDSRIVALGTRFQVQRKNHLVIVTLEAGSVEVVSEFEGKTLREQLKPGDLVLKSHDRVLKVLQIKKMPEAARASGIYITYALTTQATQTHTTHCCCLHCY